MVQIQYFKQACGVARFTYNWGLAEWQRQYRAGQKPSEFALSRHLNSIKKVDFPWMGEVTKRAPQIALKGVGSAYKRFFKGTAKYPRFKRKGVHDSFRADEGPRTSTSQAVKLAGLRVTLPRIGSVKLKHGFRYPEGRIVSCTISRTAHKWFASFQVEVTQPLPIRRENQTGSVGVDLGLKSLATLSDGTVFDNPHALRSNLKKLKRLSKAFSRRKSGSANRGKAREKLARLHYRISCLRKDALHKLTHYLVANFGLIGIEDLNVKGMAKNRCLARAISDVGFGEFRRQLEYKTEWCGSKLVVVDRWYPSSKTCSACQRVKGSLELSERVWTCTGCNTTHDRDVNAAINLKSMAESSFATACGADVSHVGVNMQPALKQESGNSL